MLTIGDHFPTYAMNACVSTDFGQEFAEITNKSFEGQWRVVFFWPMDFTFVCPTEIAAFGALTPAFAERNTQLLGCSTDSEYVHLAWRRDHPELRNLPFPMLADVKRELCTDLGVLGEDGVAMRATFIVDPDNIIQFAMVTAGSVGRNADEVLRVLDALQTGELTPCGWQPGEATLDEAELLKG